MGIIYQNLVLFFVAIDKSQNFGRVICNDDVDDLFLVCDESGLNSHILEKMRKLFEPVCLHALVSHFFNFNKWLWLSLDLAFRPFIAIIQLSLIKSRILAMIVRLTSVLVGLEFLPLAWLNAHHVDFLQSSIYRKI